MLSNCVKFEKDTESINQNVSKSSNEKMVLSNCVVCSREKARLLKKQGPSMLLSKLGIKNSFSKIPLLCDILLLKVL